LDGGEKLIGTRGDKLKKMGKVFTYINDDFGWVIGGEW
jgi:hypothetical protein